MKRKLSGMSLMEVLAATFVVGIGLLGALAVLPYGAFQVSKAKNAENAAIMLAGAAKIIQTDSLASPNSWKRTGSNHNILDEMPPATKPIVKDTDIDTRRVFMIDPHAYGNNVYTCNIPTCTHPSSPPCTEHSFHSHIYRISKLLGNTGNTPTTPQIEHEVNRWKELMTGPDDLLLTTYEDKRPEPIFEGTSKKSISSGKFTWFFTMNLVDYSSENSTSPVTKHNTAQSSLTDKEANIDVLGCHNRTPGDERTVGVVNLQTNLSGASMTLVADSAKALDLKDTKYIFVTWQYSSYTNTDTDWFTGNWCKVVNASKVETIVAGDPDLPTGVSVSGYKRNIIVYGGDFPQSFHGNANPRVLIVPGVLYHKRTNVKL